MKLITILSLILTIAIAGCNQPAPAPAPMPVPVASRTSPMNEPDRFAWELFVDLNRNAANGVTRTVWETWMLEEGVYATPKQAPVWDGSTSAPKQFRESIKDKLFREAKAKETGTDPGIAGSSLEEVRMNRAHFDYIVQNDLYYVEGQQAFRKAGKVVKFPVEARSIKAGWEPVTPEQAPRFYTQTGPDGKLYGLTSLHLFTKDIPNWFNATFEQIDNPLRCKGIPCRDSFGVTKDDKLTPEVLEMFKRAGLGNAWQNYRLTASQTDFTDPTGNPIMAGNSVLEKAVMPVSSCMTCHARATLNGCRQFLTPFGNFVGSPVPAWFASTGNDNTELLQLDFVWSLFNANYRTQAPAGCTKVGGPIPQSAKSQP